MAERIASEVLAERVRGGDPRAIARLITRAESGESECRDALAALYRDTGRAHVVGITGVPGAGKSTLVSELARTVRADGRRVAVIAIDPSSPFTGGAILGDRVRMSDLVSDPGVHPQHGYPWGPGRARPPGPGCGGRARRRRLRSRAGGDGGRGPGRGGCGPRRPHHRGGQCPGPRRRHPGHQGRDPGDRRHPRGEQGRSRRRQPHGPRAQVHADDGRAEGPEAWQVPVVPTSAETVTGFGELLAALDRRREHLHRTGEIETRRRRIASTRVVKIAEEMVREGFLKARRERIEAMLERVVARELDPYGAALELLDTVKERIRHDEQAV
ncbi:MAG: hypothetical protein U5L11_16070 [Arhodomonas sp.]|nr:hypothetical protein [Arhodomonas sp.]